MTRAPRQHRRALRRDVAMRNVDEGWGRIHLGNLFCDNDWRLVDEDVVFTDAAQTHTLTVRAADPAEPLRVTVAWSDASEAAGAGPALVNDLDLRVESSDGTVARQRPGRLMVGDRRRLGAASTTWRTSSCARRHGDLHDHDHGGEPPGQGGVPGHPALGNRDFALAISNVRPATDG